MLKKKTFFFRFFFSVFFFLLVQIEQRPIILHSRAKSVVSKPEMLCEGRKEGKKDIKDNEKARSSTTECVLTTSIWRHQHRLSCCIHAPARYVLGIRETLAGRVVVSPEILLRFLCAHGSSYDCMPF